MIVGLFSQYSSISNPAAQDLHFAVFALQHVFELLLSFRCLPIIFIIALKYILPDLYDRIAMCISVRFWAYLDNRLNPLNSLHTIHLLLPECKYWILNDGWISCHKSRYLSFWFPWFYNWNLTGSNNSISKKMIKIHDIICTAFIIKEWYSSAA